MSQQTAAEMRNIANTFNENDVSNQLSEALKIIKERAETGYYFVEIKLPYEANDRHALIAQLQRRGFSISDQNTYVYTAQVSWS
jgi:SOS response regulatory protein OraA/RecX